MHTSCVADPPQQHGPHGRWNALRRAEAIFVRGWDPVTSLGPLREDPIRTGSCHTSKESVTPLAVHHPIVGLPSAGSQQCALAITHKGVQSLHACAHTHTRTHTHHGPICVVLCRPLPFGLTMCLPFIAPTGHQNTHCMLHILSCYMVAWSHPPPQPGQPSNLVNCMQPCTHCPIRTLCNEGCLRCAVSGQCLVPACASVV